MIHSPAFDPRASQYFFGADYKPSALVLCPLLDFKTVEKLWRAYKENLEKNLTIPKLKHATSLSARLREKFETTINGKIEAYRKKAGVRYLSLFSLVT